VPWYPLSTSTSTESHYVMMFIPSFMKISSLPAVQKLFGKGNWGKGASRLFGLGLALRLVCHRKCGQFHEPRSQAARLSGAIGWRGSLQSVLLSVHTGQQSPRDPAVRALVSSLDAPSQYYARVPHVPRKGTANVYTTE
jgi:hypothetical protein